MHKRKEKNQESKNVFFWVLEFFKEKEGKKKRKQTYSLLITWSFLVSIHSKSRWLLGKKVRCPIEMLGSSIHQQSLKTALLLSQTQLPTPCLFCLLFYLFSTMFVLFVFHRPSIWIGCKNLFRKGFSFFPSLDQSMKSRKLHDHNEINDNNKVIRARYQFFSFLINIKKNPKN